MTRHFSLRSQNSEYPRIVQVTGANQNARKLLSTDLVNTSINYHELKNGKEVSQVSPTTRKTNYVNYMSQRLFTT